MCQTVGNLFRLVIVAGGIAALAFQFLTQYDCAFLTFERSGSSVFSLGLWFLGFQGECSADQYDPPDGESIIQGARSALIMSMMFGAAGLVMVTFEWLCCEVCCAGVLEGLCFCAAWILGSSVNMVYGLDICQTPSSFTDANIPNLPDLTGATCDWGTGATFNVVAVICWLGCGVLLCCTPQPEPICQK